MKNLFNFCLIAVFAVFLSSCNGEAVGTEIELPDGPEALQEFNPQTDISVFDVRVRAVSSADFVKEVILVNYANTDRLPGTLNFQGEQLFDDGSNNDLVANDGIYTSLSNYAYSNAKVTYDATQPVLSVLASAIVHPDFQYADDLRTSAREYDLRDLDGDKIVSITCDVTFGCGGCYADQWGWCDNCCICVDTDSCSITVGI